MEAPQTNNIPSRNERPPRARHSLAYQLQALTAPEQTACGVDEDLYRGSKASGDAHGKGLADLLAWWEQDAVAGEQMDDLTTGRKKRGGNFVGLENDHVPIFFGSLRPLEVCACH
jgi:hypothetical protein